MAKRRYFGTDGIRGHVGAPPITPDFLVRLGFAAGRVLADTTAANEVLISKDTRLSGYMVESALEAGLSAAGVNVLLSGPLPTSAVSYLTQTLRLSAGIVISASHNPHHDNGVKFFGADGGKLPDETESAIEAHLNAGGGIRFSGAPGRARRLDTAADRYIEFCKRAFPAFMSLRGLRVVADCANGAAYHIAPPLFHELGADVIAVGNHPDGVNINDNCGALAPAAAAKAVREHGADIAVILDGDADRVLLADENGRLYDGDALLYLIAADAVRRGESFGGVVGTILSNLALEKRLRARGVAFCRAAVGDRHVNAEMRRRQWRIGGEPAGHIILRAFHQTGDGIIAALQALRIMRENDAPLSALLGDWRAMPQQHRNIALAQNVLKQAAVKKSLRAIAAAGGGDARLIVRPSGTEPLIRVMAEGEDQTRLSAMIDRVEETLRAAAAAQTAKMAR